METFLHLPAGKRRQLCKEARSRLDLPAASIEKDFWVCWTPRELFALPTCAAHLTFKSGTSLSKGWQLIDRFSEDIDVVVDRAFLGFGGARVSKGQLKMLRKACQGWIQDQLAPALGTCFTESAGGSREP